MATPLQPQPPKQTNYLPWVLGCCAVALALGLIVVGVAGVLLYAMSPGKRTGRGFSSGVGPGSVQTVDRHGVQTVAKNWSSCSAYAPADWTIIGNEQRIAIGVDLAAADQSMSASYGVAAVAGGAYYGMATPEDYIQTMMQNSGTTGFQFDGDTQMVEGYTLRYWRGQAGGRAVRGFALYHAFDYDESTYIVALRMGSTDAAKWEQNKNIAYDVAASIRCTKHLFPAQESRAREPKGSSKDDIEREISRKRQEAMMGFQNVYSPTTGEHWEASYSDYNATGPDGPGYYRRAGNSYEKLNEGFPPN